MIGYCPQHDDGLIAKLTVEDHLYYYARLREIPKEMRKAIIEAMISQMTLENHRNKTAETLSGGNKRKLSVALTILGNPTVVLLDEPSAGMDPKARRFLWNVILDIKKRNN